MPPAEPVQRHTIAVLVDNEPGVLARVIGLFSGRGYNIESLTVAEVDPAENRSRITLVTSGTQMIIEQIKAQLDRLVPVVRVVDLTVEGPSVERELALVKVAGTGEKRIEALRVADIFRARVVDSTLQHFVFEVTGSLEKVNAFINLMRPLGLNDISRTGVVAIARGREGLLGRPASEEKVADDQARARTPEGVAAVDEDIGLVTDDWGSAAPA